MCVLMSRTLITDISQEPVQSSAHMCRFRDMAVRSVLMDEILQDPENPSIDDHLLNIDIKVSVCVRVCVCVCVCVCVW